MSTVTVSAKLFADSKGWAAREAIVDFQQLKQNYGTDPHDLVHVFDELGLEPTEQLRLLLALFDEAPSYAPLMYVMHAYRDGTPQLRREILAAYRRYLIGPDVQKAEQILYSLWCDFFEDPETVDASWRSLVGSGSPPLLLRRVLPAAGPVPWSLKRQLLHDLASSPSWHHSIFECLLHSKYDVYGQVDAPEARRILARLKLPDDTPHLQRLKSEL